MKDITYSIDKELSEQFQTLTLKTTGYTALPILTEDEDLFREREKSFAKSPYTFFRIQAGKVYSLLQTLAPQKLYFNNAPLVCDFFSKLTLSYAVSQQGENFSVSIKIQSPTASFSVSECDLICSAKPCFLIRKNFLYFFHENISWNDLKPFLQNGTSTYSREEFEKLQEEIKENGFSITFDQPIQEQTVLPVLKLKDRTGAFAALFMDYGDGSLLSYQTDPLEKSSRKRLKLQETQWEKDLIESGYQIHGKEYFCPVAKIAKTLDFLLEVGWKILDMNGKVLVRLDSFSAEFDETQKEYLLQGKTTFKDFSVDTKGIAFFMKAKQTFIPLDGKSVGLLYRERKDLLPFADLSDELEIYQEKAVLKKTKLGLLDESAKACTAIQIRSLAIDPLQHTDLFHGSLYPYQEHGVSWLNALYQKGFSALLADEMGLGKTVQVIGFLTRLGLNARTLIAVPTTLLFNWEKEIRTFFPKAKLHLYHGPDRKAESLADKSLTIILTSYGILRKDYAHFEKQAFDVIVLDEAQAIKNSASHVAQSAQKLQSRFRISLTGTPIENSLDELHSHFQFLLPDLLQKEEMLPSFAKKVQKKIQPFVLRRKKEDVAIDLPEKIEQEVIVQMQEDENAHYLKLIASFQQGLIKKVTLDGAQKHSLEILEAILRLRQTACHPSLTNLSTTTIHSSKFECVCTDLETILREKKKVIVFSQFAKMLFHFATYARNSGWKYLLLDGSTTNRKEIIDRFQTDPEEQLLFMSLKAGGVGLNVTAADYVILYEPWWNEAVENQAFARAHRIGRKDTVILKRYIVKDTIEEAIQKLKLSKKELSDAIFEDASFVNTLTVDELLTCLK